MRRPARRPVPGRRTLPHAAPALATGSDDFHSRAWGGSGAWWCGRLAAVSSWSVGADREAARAGTHMGEEGLRGANTVFRWDSADPSGSSRPVDALPCAHRGVCAHGSASVHPGGRSKIAESRGKFAFVPASSFSPMCNTLLRPGQRTRCRRRHQRLQDLRYDRARGDGALSARHRPCGLVRPAPPGSRRNADLGSPPMGRVRRRAAHGRAAARPFEPISARRGRPRDQRPRDRGISRRTTR